LASLCYSLGMDSFVADRIFVDAPLERVFAAFVEPEDVLVWFDADRALVDARVGGEFLIERKDGTKVSGTISEHSPPRRLVLSGCSWEACGVSRGPSRIVLSADPCGEGVWLNVRHEELDGQRGWQAFAEDVRRDWVRATAALERPAAGI